MGFSLKWYPNLIHFHYHGTVTGQDILQSNLAVYGDARFDDLRWEVASFDQGCAIEATFESVRQIAYFDRAAAKSNPRIRILLAGDKRIQKTIYENYAEHAFDGGWEVTTFETCADAFAHAGVKPRTVGE